MLYCAAGALALAASANAFIIPTGIEAVDDLSATTVLDPSNQAIKIPCPECVIPTSRKDQVSEESDGDDLLWAQGGATDLFLDFKISDSSRALTINGFQIYPITMESPEQPTVAEVAASASLADVKTHPEQTTTRDVSAASIFVEEELISAAGDKVVSVDYHIMSLDDQVVSVDAVEVKMLEGGDGSLMIISVQGVPAFDGIVASAPSPRPTGHGPRKCNMPSALCQIKSMFESAISGFKHDKPHRFGGKGCGGHKGANKLSGHLRPHLDHAVDFDSVYFEFENGKHGEESDRPKHHHDQPPRPHSKGSDHEEHKDHPHTKGSKHEEHKDHPHTKGSDHKEHENHPHFKGSDHKEHEDHQQSTRPKHHHERPDSGDIQAEDGSEHAKHRHGESPHRHANGPHVMHHGRPHHHPGARFMHKFVGAVVGVLVPVIAGITMGMFVSLLGMAVGRMIGYLWIKFRRGGQRGYSSVPQSEKSMEKGSLEMPEEEPLPAYEDAPAYEDEKKDGKE